MLRELGLKELYTIGKMSINAAILYKNEEMCRNQHVKTVKMDSSYNQLSFWIIIYSICLGYQLCTLPLIEWFNDWVLIIT